MMTGDAEKIMQLYLEMIGEAEPEDLSQVWAVRLGECTEQLQLDWYEEKNALVSRRGEVVIHPRFPWAACTLDGWDGVLGCPIEAKHCGGREPLEVLIERYQPQIQWQMECTGATTCALSVILGAREPVIEFIEADPEYQFEMIMRGSTFMHCVQNRIVPVALEPVPAPVDAAAVYDFSGRNEWASHAAQWLETREASEKCKEAEKILKALVPADAKRCTGHGVMITRDRAGRLSLREQIQ